MEIFNKHDKAIYLDGSYLICNLKQNADKTHYLSINIGELLPDFELGSGVKKKYEFDLPPYAEKALIDPVKFCRISLLASDYDGKTAIIANPVIDLSTIQIKGRYVGEDGK